MQFKQTILGLAVLATGLFAGQAMAATPATQTTTQPVEVACCGTPKKPQVEVACCGTPKKPQVEVACCGTPKKPQVEVA
jgi:hypothetical protein